MDDSVTRHGVANVLCPLVIALAAHGVAAAGLPDPTRPAISSPDSDGGAAVTEFVLQSVLVSAERNLAIISGRVVPLGGELDGWRLVRLTEARAWLRGPEGERMLVLYGGVTRDANVKSPPRMPLKRLKNTNPTGL